MLSRGKRSAIALGCCIAALVFQDPGNASTQPQPRERHVRKIPTTTRPIAESLRPEDDIVVLEWILTDRAVPEKERTPAEELAAAVSASASTTAIVTVTGVSGVLAWDNTWVQTKFVATVNEVLAAGKNVTARDRVTRDQAIEFFVEGGEAAVDGVIVRAGELTRYPIGRRYLVFLNQKGRENGWSVDSTPLLIEGDRLSAVAPSASRLSGLTLADVRKAIGETK